MPDDARVRRREAVAADLQQLYADVKGVVEGEVQQASADWTLVRQCNDVLTSRFKEFSDTADNVHDTMRRVDQEFASYEEYFGRVDELESSLSSAEMVVSVLDAYTRKLEELYCNTGDIGAPGPAAMPSSATPPPRGGGAEGEVPPPSLVALK